MKGISLRLSRKGMSYEQITPIAVAFVILGVSAAIGLQVLTSFTDTMDTTTSVVNDSTVCTNATYAALDYNYVKSVTSIKNVSVTLLAGNYTCTSMSPVRDSCNVTIMTEGPYAKSGQTWNISYERYNSADFYAAQNASAGVAQLMSWLPILAIVFAAVIVIGVLTGFGRKESSGI